MQAENQLIEHRFYWKDVSLRFVGCASLIIRDYPGASTRRLEGGDELPRNRPASRHRGFRPNSGEPKPRSLLARTPEFFFPPSALRRQRTSSFETWKIPIRPMLLEFFPAFQPGVALLPTEFPLRCAKVCTESFPRSMGLRTQTRLSSLIQRYFS
jgi:hypothetical protein